MSSNIDRDQVLRIATSLRWCAPQISSINPSTANLVRDAADLLERLIIESNRKNQNFNSNSNEFLQNTINDLINNARDHTNNDPEKHHVYLLALQHVQSSLIRAHTNQ